MFWKKKKIPTPTNEPMPPFYGHKSSLEISDSDYKRIVVWHKERGLGSVVKHKEGYGFDIAWWNGELCWDLKHRSFPRSIQNMLWDYVGFVFYYQEPLTHIKLVFPEQTSNDKKNIKDRVYTFQDIKDFYEAGFHDGRRDVQSNGHSPASFENFFNWFSSPEYKKLQK